MWATTRICCLASLCLRCASSIEDMGTLIQRERSVALQAEGFSAADNDREAPLPDPGPRGVKVSRLSARGSNGSSIQLWFSHFCNEEDEFGPSECTLYWGMPLRSEFKVHLASGVSRGDIVATSYAIMFDSYNKKSFWSLFVPRNLMVDTECGVCEGSCMYSEVDGDISLSIMTPTHLDDPDACSKLTPQEDFILKNQTTLLTAPPSDLELVGNVTMGVSVMSKGGDTRVEGFYNFRLSGEGDEPMPPASKDLNESLEQPTMGFFGLVGQGLRDAVADVTQAINASVEAIGLGLVGDAAVAEASERSSSEDSTHGLWFNVTVKEMEGGNGTNISLWSDLGCEIVDDRGSTSCLIPFGDSYNFSASLNLAFIAEEGSYLRFRSQNTIGGTLGRLFASKTKPKEFTVPFCGHELVTLISERRNMTYLPMRCGFYSIEFSTLVPVVKKMVEFKDFTLPSVPLMPFLPRNFDAWLPIASTVELDIRHKDGSAIARVELGIGLTLL